MNDYQNKRIREAVDYALSRGWRRQAAEAAEAAWWTRAATKAQRARSCYLPTTCDLCQTSQSVLPKDEEARREDDARMTPL